MIAQPTHYMTDGYELDSNIMTVDWFDSNSVMGFPNQGEPLDTTPSSRRDSEVTLVGSSEIISLLQDVKNSVDDNKKSIDELNRRVSETQAELHLLQETFATLQNE